MSMLYANSHHPSAALRTVATTTTTTTTTTRSASCPSFFPATSPSSVDLLLLPPDAEDNFGRYSKFLVKNSNGVDGMGGQRTGGGNDDGDGRDGSIVWVDTLNDDDGCPGPGRRTSRTDAPRRFSILSWNILAQSLYESQYQRRRIQQVALASPSQPRLPTLSSLSSSSSSSSSYPHPHPWPKRLKRIVEVLSHANADVVCLQECEHNSFRYDLVPALSNLGYDGIAQEDDRPDAPTVLRESSKHRDPRHHIAATFWRRDAFEPVGESSARSRTLTTILRQRGRSDGGGGGGGGEEEEGGGGGNMRTRTTITPTVAVVNAHLEGHPRRFAERTHQLQHALADLAKRVRREDNDGGVRSSGTAAESIVDDLNALIVAGDFNCELQSSACSTYLRMGRLGRQAGLGGAHGEDSLVLPPSLLETTEATEVLHPIMEWGRALPEDAMADVEPHPFRRNGLTSAYPAWLGRDDPRSHFTFCSESNKRPVPGLDQIWFTSMTLERVGLRRMFVDDSGLWERYFYDDVEVEKRREDERRNVLATGLPSLECKYPSDHLPIGAIFQWRLDECRDYGGSGRDDSVPCTDVGEVRVLSVVDSEGNDVQKIMQNIKQRAQMQEHSLMNPREELDYLLNSCPYDSEAQRYDVKFVLSPIDPPLSLASSERPTPDQMMQLDARHVKKAQLLSTASLGVRPWLKNIWKANKQVGKWDRQRLVEKHL